MINVGCKVDKEINRVLNFSLIVVNMSIYCVVICCFYTLFFVFPKKENTAANSCAVEEMLDEEWFMEQMEPSENKLKKTW